MIAVAARNRGIRKIEGIEKTRAFVPRHFDIDAASAIAIERALVEFAIVLGLFPVGLNAQGRTSVRSSRPEVARIASRIDSPSSRRIG